MNVLNANVEDIYEMEAIGKKSYEKMELSKIGISYNTETFLKNIKTYIENDHFIVLKCVEGDKIIGGILATCYPQLYSDKYIIQEFSMQSSPDLPVIKQGRVLIKLIKALERIAKERNVELLGISIMPKYDISKYLESKNYKKSDLNFIRRFI